MGASDRNDVTTVERTLDDPDAIALVDEMRREVLELYGRPDVGTTLTPEMFQPPLGRFLVSYLGERAVGCAGYRRLDDRLGRVQRVYVRPEARGRSLSRGLLVMVEQLAVADGLDRLELHTGPRQPSAVHVYESLGYQPIPLFSPYEGDPLSLCYAKAIGA